MKRLIDTDELRKILERGLLSGLWSTLQFNKGGRDVVLPGKQFLEDNPKFQNMEHRDLESYRKNYKS